MAVKVGDSARKKTVKEMLPVFLDTELEIADVRDNRKDLSACKEVADTDERECLKKAGFQKIVIGIGDGK